MSWTNTSFAKNAFYAKVAYMIEEKNQNILIK